MIEEGDDNAVEQLNEFHTFFTYILGIENFEAAPSNVEDNTLKIL